MPTALRLLALVVASAGSAVHAQDSAAARPSAAFVQFSVARGHTTALVAGLTRDWDWRRQARYGTLTGYWEAALGRWTTGQDAEKATSWVTQAGITPVLRWHPGDTGWFVEGGIGLHVLAPIYRKPDKRFSTTLNFGDHIALGRRFGPERRHEVSLRLQHFSNGGFRDPNPGENFLQLRYANRF